MLPTMWASIWSRDIRLWTRRMNRVVIIVVVTYVHVAIFATVLCSHGLGALASKRTSAFGDVSTTNGGAIVIVQFQHIVYAGLERLPITSATVIGIPQFFLSRVLVPWLHFPSEEGF